MGRGGGTDKLFAGPVIVAGPDDVAAFVRRARRGERFVYCEAPELVRSPTSARVNELTGAGLVVPLSEKRERGGWRYLVERTGKPQPRARSAAEAALADPFTQAIFRTIEAAAASGARCPSDSALARTAGLSTRDQAQWRVRKLVEAGLIASELAYEGGIPTRVVTIAATGASTALPAKWADKAGSTGNGR